MSKVRLAFSLIAMLAASQFLATQAKALDEIMKNYRGIRSLGMGGVVTTTGLYDEALFGNPATQMEAETWKLSILSVTAEANSNFISDVNKVSNATSKEGTAVISALAESGIAGRNEHSRITMLVPGFYSPKLFGENTGFSAALLFNAQTNILLHNNVVADSQSFVDAGPAFGFGHKLLDGALNVGVNVRMLYRLAADRSLYATSFLAGQKFSISDVGGQGIGLDADLGAYYKLPIPLPGFLKNIGLGASLNNVAASEYQLTGKSVIKKVTSSPPGNDRSFNGGVRTDFSDLFFLTGNLIAIELQDIGATGQMASFFKKVHIGGETKPLKFLAVRGGVNQGYFGGGLGFDLPLLKIDLATYGEELGSNAGQLEDRRYTVRVALEI